MVGQVEVAYRAFENALGSVVEHPKFWLEKHSATTDDPSYRYSLTDHGYVV